MNRKIFNLTFAASAGLLVALACSFLPGGAKTEGKTTPAPSTQDGEKLDCERESYPCSYSETPIGVLKASFGLMEQAGAALEATGSMADAAEAIRDDPQMADLFYTPEALRFRLDGGAPMWLLHPDTPEATFPKAVARESSPTKGLAKTLPAILQGPGLDNDGPVGEEEPGEEPKKRALLLSPYLWDFGDDETDEVAMLLGDQRNYSCPGCIATMVAEEPPTEPEEANTEYGFPLEAFMNWDEYDLINVSTHGRQYCQEEKDEKRCFTLLETGRFSKIDREKLDAKDFQQLPTGAYWAGIARDGEVKVTLALSTDFFRAQYPGGLDDKVIFFNACETTQIEDLVAALAGENTAVLGWSAAVDSPAAEEIAVKFYELLLEDGLRAGVAYEKTLDFEGYDLGFEEAGAGLVLYGSKEPRGREVVTWLHPVYRWELEDGESVPIEGVAGDGQRDRLQVLFQVDGIDDSQNPEDFVIQVSIDDVEQSETFTPTRQIDEFSYWAEGSLELPFDADGPQDFKLEAWIALPEGGRTRHVLEEIEPAGCGWTANLSDPAVPEEIRGDFLITLEHLLATDPEILQALESAGQAPSSAELAGPFNLPAAGEGPTPLVVIMKDGERFLTFYEEEGVVLSLAPSSLETMYMNRNRTQRLPFSTNLIERSDERLEGSLNATVARGILPGETTYSLTSDFLWEAGSYCDLEIVYQMYLNALENGARPSADGP